MNGFVGIFGMVELVQKLTESDLKKYFDSCFTCLSILNQKYSPNINIVKGIPLQIEYIDYIRGSWLVDESPDRASYVNVVEATGYLFGLLLEQQFGYSWYLVKSKGSQFPSLIKTGTDGEQISIPPYSYVRKRENLQNVEVFRDFFIQLEGK